MSSCFDLSITYYDTSSYNSLSIALTVHFFSYLTTDSYCAELEYADSQLLVRLSKTDSKQIVPVIVFAPEILVQTNNAMPKYIVD